MEDNTLPTCQRTEIFHCTLAVRGGRVSRSRVFAVQLPPFLSSLSESLSQDLLQHDVNVFSLGSNVDK